MARNTLPALKGLLAKYTAQEAIPKGERRVIDDQIVIGTGNPYYAWRRPDKKGMILLNPQEGNIGNQSSGEAVPGGETAGKNNDPFELTEEQSYHLGRLLRGWADTPGGFDEVRDILPDGFFDDYRTSQHDLFLHDGRRYLWVKRNPEDEPEGTSSSTLDEIEGAYIRVTDWRTGIPQPEVTSKYLGDFEPIEGKEPMKRFLVSEIEEERRTLDQAIELDRYNAIIKDDERHFHTYDGQKWIRDRGNGMWNTGMDSSDSSSEDSSESSSEEDDSPPSPGDPEPDVGRRIFTNDLEQYLNRQMSYKQLKRHDAYNFVDHGNDDELLLRDGTMWIFNKEKELFELLEPREPDKVAELRRLRRRDRDFETFSEEDKKVYNNELRVRFTGEEISFLEAQERDVFNIVLWGNDDTEIAFREGSFYTTYLCEIVADGEERLKRWRRQPVAPLVLSDPEVQRKIQVLNYKDVNPLGRVITTHKPGQQQREKAPSPEQPRTQNPNDPPNRGGTQNHPTTGGKTGDGTEAAAERERLRLEAEEKLAAKKAALDLPEMVIFGGRTWAGPIVLQDDLTEQEHEDLGLKPQMTRFRVDKSPAPEDAAPPPPPPASARPSGTTTPTRPSKEPTTRNPDKKGGKKGGKQAPKKGNKRKAVDEPDDEESRARTAKRQETAKKAAATKARNKRQREEDAEEQRLAEEQAGPSKSQKQTSGMQTRSRAK